jgi:hypothetical protein
VRPLFLSSLLALGCTSSHLACTSKHANAQDYDAGPWPPESGVVQDGVYTCCAPDSGLACCAERPGLLGFGFDDAGNPISVGSGGIDGAGKVANCFQYGGFGGRCTGAGEWYEGKDTCSLCCDGLRRTALLVPSQHEAGIFVQTEAGVTCEYAAPPSVVYCLPCGNGVCDTNENPCVCPADCPPDAGTHDAETSTG